MYAAIVLLLAALAVMAAGLHRFYQPANASNSPARQKPTLGRASRKG